MRLFNKHAQASTLITLMVALASASICPLATATPQSASAKFHGTILVVECTVNGNSRQTVDFGDAVGIHKIDGKQYLEPVPFVVDCQNYSGGELPAMTLTLEGASTSFDGSAIATDVPGLGIQINMNGKAQSLNEAVKFDVNNVPELTAVPVKQPGVELVAKPFTATVKLRVDVA